MAPTKSHILSIFNHLTSGDAQSFFANVTDDVHWVITGSSHPLAKTWNSKEQFIQESWKRIGSVLQKPMRLSVVSVLVEPAEGEDEGLEGRALVELKGIDGVMKNGMLLSYGG